MLQAIIKVDPVTQCIHVYKYSFACKIRESTFAINAIKQAVQSKNSNYNKETQLFFSISV
jgi:hypothetical protein